MSNFSPNYSVTEKYATENVLPKSGYKQISYKGNLAVTEFNLEQNYPNPFNPVTRIKYQILNRGNVTLKGYDILGSEVSTLVNEVKDAGYYEVEFDVSQKPDGYTSNSLSSGVYLYELKSGDFRSVKKMTLVK